MSGIDRLSRRELLARAALASAALSGLAGCGSTARSGSAPAAPVVPTPPAVPTRPVSAATPPRRPPNVLVVLVDQLRQPRWLDAPLDLAVLLPALTELSERSVRFASHYTAANDCTPSRAALLTGLYTHQTGCLITSGSTLSPLFPTYGSLMREYGYRSWWYGKWHLTRGDNRWMYPTRDRSPLRYGFEGGTYPSPDGGPNQGLRVDPLIAGQFESWLARHADDGPWCTTVSFVNPHDIAFWYRYTGRAGAEQRVPARFDALPSNFETPAELIARGKPLLQLGLQDSAAAAFGVAPYEGPDVVPDWTDMLDVYLRLQQRVDAQIGRVLGALARRPDVAANTVVVFTSDHGEYAGAHGMRGKGASAYEEAINVPLTVYDPRGELTAHVGHTRRQLTSSVDVAALLLTIAHGSDDWRNGHRYGHLAERADLAAICRDPAAHGRRSVLHATDEIVTAFDTQPAESSAPLHVIGVRTREAKYVTYSHWSSSVPGSVSAEGQEAELYDYDSHEGRTEVDNLLGPLVRATAPVVSDGPLATRAQDPTRAVRRTLEARARVAETHRAMSGLLDSEIAGELQRPLPRHLQAAQRDGMANCAAVQARVAAHIADRRESPARKLVGAGRQAS